MAIARIDPAYARRYTPPAARRAALERQRSTIFSGRALVLGLVAAGALLQHTLVSMPLEPQPVRPGFLSPSAVLAAPAPRPAQAPLRAIAAAPKTSTITAITAPRLPAVLPRAGSRTSLAAPVQAPKLSKLSVVLPPVGVFGDAHRVALSANLDGALMHAPSVSVAALRAALQAAGSPALDAAYADHKDAAEYIWDSGRVLGVDPAVVMAIFQHESAFGTRGMARQTRSVGNIRPLPGQPQLNGYRLYASWQQGIDDCYRLLRSYAANGAGTIPQAIPVWAPPSDNNDDSAYIASVLDTMSALYAASAKL